MPMELIFYELLSYHVIMVSSFRILRYAVRLEITTNAPSSIHIPERKIRQNVSLTSLENRTKWYVIVITKHQNIGVRHLSARLEL